MAERRHMRRTSEKGEGRMSAFIFFALLIAVGLAAWNLIPVYYAHYDFTDRVEEICRTPRYKARTEKVIKDMLMKEVAARRLIEWIKLNNFRVTTTQHNRQIILKYEREVEILPGWKQVLKFDYEADQPLL